MSSPLNRKLYDALIATFGYVEISSPGESFIGQLRSSYLYPGRQLFAPVYSGEYYRISCPFCNDTRKRLYINHMFNVVVERDDHLYMACCFNEQCIDSREKRVQLRDMIFPFCYGGTQRMDAIEEFRSSESNEDIPIEVRLPFTLGLRDSLSFSACDYLQSRGFDPDELSERWGVGYCLVDPHATPSATGRIIIPVYKYIVRFGEAGASILCGWQARKVGLAGDSPKYLTMKGMRKSEMLYGLPQAVASDGPIVIVEGATDVWRLGSHAVALFGKTISPQQNQLLNCHLSNRPLVIALDRDAQDDAMRICATIRESRARMGNPNPVSLCLPPDGAKDFGDTTREAAWAAVCSALSAR